MHRFITSLSALAFAAACSPGADSPRLPPTMASPDGGPPETPEPLPGEPCGDRDERRCDARDEPPSECAPGEILPDRLIEFRLPVNDLTATLGPNDIGRAFNSRLEPLRFGSSYVFDEEDLRIEMRELNGTRTEVIDADRHEGSRLGTDVSVDGFALDVGRSGTRENDFTFMQIVERDSVVFLDDRSAEPRYERLPDNADFYLYGIEFGRAWRLVSYAATGTNSMNLSFDIDELTVGKKDEATTIDLGFSLLNWSRSNSFQERMEFLGFTRTGADGCNALQGAEDFERCYMPADPVPVAFLFRNVPRRCIERERADPSAFPVLVDVDLRELRVEDAGGDETDWSLTAVCEVDSANALVIDSIEGISLEGVQSGESFLIDPASRKVVEDLAILPGARLRCGVSGRVNDGSATGTVIRYVEDEVPIDALMGEDSVLLERSLGSNGTGAGPRFSLSYEVQVKALL